MATIDYRGPAQNVSLDQKPLANQRTRIFYSSKADNTFFGMNCRIWKKWYTVSTSNKPVVSSPTYTDALRSNSSIFSQTTNSELGPTQSV